VLASYHSALRELDQPGVYFFDPFDDSTVDDAYRAFRAAGPSVTPRDALDALYSWDSVARTVLDLRPGADARPARLAGRAA
jgi:hypothetical protein